MSTSRIQILFMMVNLIMGTQVQQNLYHRVCPIFNAECTADIGGVGFGVRIISFFSSIGKCQFSCRFFSFQVHGVEECQSLCDKESSCHFYSWWSKGPFHHICAYHEECPELNFNCTHCFAGPEKLMTGCTSNIYMNDFFANNVAMQKL